MASILLVKETKAKEQRVSLIPSDVRELINNGFKVFVEHNAGLGAGFTDQDYETVGANIRSLDEETLSGYKSLFQDIELVVRAKRPEREREILENQAIQPNTIMIGGLDPLEPNAKHIQEYHQAKIIAYSIDQLNLTPDDPMNILASMSHMAGQLALQDAISQYKGKVNKAVIIGFGVVGKAALQEALNQGIKCSVILTNLNQGEKLKAQGIELHYLDKTSDLHHQQALVKRIINDADIIITSARAPSQKAPLLIPSNTLATLKKGTVIVDMALSEGGNVEGSEHDTTHCLGNDVIVTNKSGYPKVFPKEASILWSRASYLFITKLKNHQINLTPC